MEVAGEGFALGPSTYSISSDLFRPLPANLNLITTYGAMDDSPAECFG
jgi:hypothetical protein